MLWKHKESITSESWQRLLTRLREEGVACLALEEPARHVLVTGELSDSLCVQLQGQGFHEVDEDVSPYPAVSRGTTGKRTIVEVQGVRFGGDETHVIAGPCAVEGRDSLLQLAGELSHRGVRWLRGGLYKPRTSPYAFQGVRDAGIPWLAEVKERFGLIIVTEALDAQCLEKLRDVADVIQIGSRNMHNFSLLREVGAAGKPVLLKRGMSATMKEFLLAAEYVVVHGNPQVVLCERGIRTFADHARNTLDLSAVPFLQAETHLPVLVDPSHGTGRADFVRAMSRAALAAGADGVMMEVHADPDSARSDGFQSLRLDEFPVVLEDLKRIAEAMGRPLRLEPR